MAEFRPSLYGHDESAVPEHHPVEHPHQRTREMELCAGWLRELVMALQDDDVAPLVEKAGMEVPVIDEHFEDLSKLSHSSLRNYAILILER